MKHFFVASAFIFSQSVLGQTTFTDLGLLGGSTGAAAFGISTDGSTVVGQVYSPSNAHAFRWTQATGMIDIGVLLGGTNASGLALNGDGSVAVGFGDPFGFRWTAGNGMQSIGALPGGNNSSAKSVSSNGTVIAGQSSNGLSLRAFKWTSATGLTDLGALGSSSISSGEGISADGSTIVGWSLGDTTQRAFRWTSSTGMVDIGPGTAAAANNNGSVVVGGNTSAFRWTAGTGMQSIGGAFATACSSIGDVVVGRSNNRAFAWTSSLGGVDLNVFLPTQGVNLTGWLLTAATGISADGTAIVGYGTFNGQLRGWIAKNVKLNVSDWTQWAGNGHWYRVVYVPQGLSWKEADVIAKQQGGHLASMTSAAENDFVFSIINDSRYFVTEQSTGNILGPWIGLIQPDGSQEPGGGWKWVTGEPLSYSRWYPGEPNNNGGNENVACYMQKQALLGPTWNDIIEGTSPRNNPQIVSLVVESPYPPATWQFRADNGHWYKAVSCPDGIRWTDAQAQAAMEGGYLATTTDLSENLYVYGLLFSDRYRRPDTSNATYIGGWIGLWQPENGAEPAGGWLWSSLETSAYRTWTPGEPNNFLDIEDYANYRYPIGSNQSTWNDFPNTGFPDETVPSFVIEKDSPPILGNIFTSCVPTTVTFSRGLVAGGLLPSLFEIDSNPLQIKKGLVLNAGEAPMNFVIGSTSPWSTATAIEFNLTLRANSPSINMVVEAYDWQAQTFVPIDNRATPTTDTTLTYNLSNPSRFIKDAVREIRIRFQFKATGPVSTIDWRVLIDRAKLLVKPL